MAVPRPAALPPSLSCQLEGEGLRQEAALPASAPLSSFSPPLQDPSGPHPLPRVSPVHLLDGEGRGLVVVVVVA